LQNFLISYIFTIYRYQDSFNIKGIQNGGIIKMKHSFKFILSAALIVPLLGVILAAAQDNPAEGYHDYQALTQKLQQIKKVNPDITELLSIGKSASGKDLWMLQLSGKGKTLSKQALLIVGNLEGDHVIGSEVALGIAEHLINNYGKSENVTSILDERTFYILPRLNPDGAEAFFGDTLQVQTGNLNPRDEDYDWKEDEDGPEDLNGDGMITLMRIKDKDGEWMIDEDDPRLMKKKEDGTPLEQLYKIYPEGRDDDGDNLYNEDGPGGFNINRNFPHNFGYNAKGFKVYPASEKETRALIDFMTRYVPEYETQPHKNICGILLFSKYDNLAAGTGIECGTPDFPGVPEKYQASPAAGGMTMFMFGLRGEDEEGPKRPPSDPQPKKTNPQDEYIFKNINEKYKEITEIKSAESEKPFGSLLEWGYFQFGVPTFSANLWSLRKAESEKSDRNNAGEEPEGSKSRDVPSRTDPPAAMMPRMMGRTPGSGSQPDSSSKDKRWLQWIDQENNGRGFINWTKFNHPQLGDVEIGGFRPYLRTNPPAEHIPELSRTHAEFAIFLASQFAEIQMEKSVVEKLSSSLYRVKVKLQNTGELPYTTAMGIRTRNINPIMLQLKFEDDEQMELFGGSKRNELDSLPAGGEMEYEWTIISPADKKIVLSLFARNGGGKSEKTIVLK
jgi:murein tripeptide amidase MpaA